MGCLDLRATETDFSVELFIYYWNVKKIKKEEHIELRIDDQII